MSGTGTLTKRPQTQRISSAVAVDSFATWRRSHALLLTCSALVVAIGMVLSFVDFPFFHLGVWYVTPDHWYPVLQARFVYFGATGAVYQGNVITSALPGLAILYAPAVALGDHLHLVQGLPFPVAQPTMWLVVGPEAFAVGSVLFWGVDRLATELAVPQQRRRVLIGVSAVLVFQVVYFAGHPEDCAALGLLCYALAAHLRGEHGKVGWWLSAAILMQTWVLLVCPLLLLATPAGQRLRMIVRAALFPGLLFLICCLAAPSDTWRQVLSEQPMPTTGQHTPWYSIAPRLVRFGKVAGAPSRRWGAVAAAVYAVAVSRRLSTRGLLLSVAAILLARPLFETSDWAYFSMPGLVLIVVLASKTRWQWWYGLLCLFMLLTTPTYGYLYFPHLNEWLFLVLLALTNGAALAGGIFLTRSSIGDTHSARREEQACAVGTGSKRYVSTNEVELVGP